MRVYLRTIRPGRVLEATAIGVVLLLAAVIGGGLIDDTGLGEALTLSKEWLVLALVIYGFVASVLPVWLLLTPRDYLSTFMKVGRSEEHTSELQSRQYLVCRLLLEKKKQ